MDFSGLTGGLQAALGELDLVIDQAVIDQAVKTLHDTSGDLSDSGFRRLQVPASVFGASARGLELGDHHGKAHQVIKATLEGVILDLEGFADGLRRAEELVRSADDDAADQLARRQAAAELLVHASQHSHGDERNHEARNEYLRDGGDDA